MCIVFIAKNIVPDFPLIICANRDEFYARPTESPFIWNTRPKVVAGQDKVAGGSWLGLNNHGSFSAVTNLRTSHDIEKPARSRGELVIESLTNARFNEQWLRKQADQYAPFNLLWGNQQKIYYFHSKSGQYIQLSDGIHAISNGFIDEEWPKMATGKLKIQSLLQQNKNWTAKKLFALLRDQTQAPEHQLPNTGVPYQWEKILSSIFIQTPEYGTRSSSIMSFRRDESVFFETVEYHQDGRILNDKQFTLKAGIFD